MTQPPLLAVMQGGEYRSPETQFVALTESGFRVLQHSLEGGERLREGSSSGVRRGVHSTLNCARFDTVFELSSSAQTSKFPMSNMTVSILCTNWPRASVRRRSGLYSLPSGRRRWDITERSGVKPVPVTKTDSPIFTRAAETLTSGLFC